MKKILFILLMIATVLTASCSNKNEKEVNSDNITKVPTNPSPISTITPSVDTSSVPTVTPVLTPSKAPTVTPTIIPVTITCTPIPTQSNNDQESVDASLPRTSNERSIEPLPDLPQQISKKTDIAPKGWSILDYKKNDFNGDGLKDIVGVLEHPVSFDVMYPRILFIYFNNGNGYSLNLMNPYLIRNSDEGGVFGDPYEEITVSDHTFTTNAFGGSAWKWSENNTFEYKNGDWYLLYEDMYYGYGGFETSYSYNDYQSGTGLRRVTEESPDKENPEKLEYNVKLDQQPLLEDYAYTLFNSVDRIKAPIIKSVSYIEGIEHFEGGFPELGEYEIMAWNKEYVVYHISQSDSVVYIGVLSLQSNNLQMISRYEEGDQKEVDLDKYSGEIYNNRLYYVEEISSLVSVRSDGIVSDNSEVIAVQLVSVKLDGTDKKVIYIADHPQYKKDNVIEDYLSFLSLSYEITGDEIIVMVYGGENHPYYRMNLKGKEISFIGSVPRGDF